MESRHGGRANPVGRTLGRASVRDPDSQVDAFLVSRKTAAMPANSATLKTPPRRHTLPPHAGPYPSSRRGIFVSISLTYARPIDIVLDGILDIGSLLRSSRYSSAHHAASRRGVQMGQLSVDLSTRIKDLPLQPKPLRERRGVTFPRYFTARVEAGKTPYDEIRWELRTASIGNDKGAVIFEQRDVEIPADWSQTATNIVASKYFHGKAGAPDRERSVAELVHRVVDTIADWGKGQGYFKTGEDGENFRNELAHLMLTQKACFNSPVWFNVGVKEARGYGWYYDHEADAIRPLTGIESRPQCSACFINSVADSDRKSVV